VNVGEVRCVGSVSSLGKRVAIADALLLDGSDRRLAQGTASCLLISGQG
jgi:acyl-coenzyme A thioesterase PaaI-like protein